MMQRTAAQFHLLLLALAAAMIAYLIAFGGHW